MAHSKNIIDNYADVSTEVFDQIQKHSKISSITEMLDGPICHSGFQRLT